MGCAPAVADVARLPSIGAPVFSMRGEPKPRSPVAASQPARTTVPHNAANTTTRRGLITSSLPVSSEAHLDSRCTPKARDGLFFSDQNGPTRKKTAGNHLFGNVLPEYNPILSEGKMTAHGRTADVAVKFGQL